MEDLRLPLAAPRSWSASFRSSYGLLPNYQERELPHRLRASRITCPAEGNSRVLVRLRSALRTEGLMDRSVVGFGSCILERGFES